MWGGGGGGAGGTGAWCGACLATGVRLLAAPGACALRAVALQFQEGEGNAQLCFECAASVSKFHLFRHKCERARRLLRQMYEQHDEITESRVQMIDRAKHKLISPYRITTAYLFNLVINKSETDYTKIINPESDSEIHHLEFDFDTIKKEECGDEVTEACDETELLEFDDVKLKNTDGLRRNKKRHKIDVNGGHDKNKVLSITKHETDKSCIKDFTKPRKHRTKSSKERNNKYKHSKRSIKSESKRTKVEHQPEADHDKQVNKKLSVKKSCESFATVVAVSQGEQMEEIQKRQETESFKKSQHKCVLCYKGFMEEKAYYNHSLKHEPISGAFQCDVCKIRFRQKRHVRNHIYAVHMTKYVCKVCAHVSTSLEQATNHHKWHTGVTYKCHICGEVSSKVTTHLSHVRLKHPSPHICSACGRSFVSDKGLTMHRRLIHKEASDNAKPSLPANNVESHKCADCNVEFTSLSAWKHHMVLSHRDLKEFGNGCRHCGETFATADEYREHYRLSHKQHRHKKYGNKTWDRPKQCEHFNASLTYHRREHSGEMPHRCAVCPRAFPTRAQLEKHGTVHSDERPHVCHLCPKAFKEKSALTRHIRNHSGVRPYPCQTCGKAFTEASSRKLHYRTVHLKLPAPYISKARLNRKLAKTDTMNEAQTFN